MVERGAQRTALQSPTTDDADPLTSPDRERGGPPWALLVLALVLLLALANRLTFDTWIARFDFYSFFVPWYAYLGEQLRAFNIPGWNPHLFSGTPFAGDPESGWLYAPAMIAMTLFPVITGFKAMAAIQLTIAAFSTYALGRSLRLGPGAALVAAAAYVVGPLLQWNTFCCLVLAGFAVWTPLLLFGIERAFQAPTWQRRVAPCIGSAFALSQMFAGWVGQGWFLGPLLVIAYVGYRTLLPVPATREELMPRLVNGFWIAAAVGLGGAGLGAAGILPRLDVNFQSNLSGANYTGRGAEGMLNPPWSLEYLFIHTLGAGYDHRQAAWAGATVVLALLAPFVARNRHQVPFFAGLLAVSLIMTLPNTPLHHLFYLIPGFQELHEHDAWRMYTVGLIAPAIMAGATVEQLWRRRGTLWLAPVACFPVVLIGLAAALFGRGDWVVRWAPTFAAAAMTLAVLWALFGPIRAARLGGRWLPAAAVILIVLQPTALEWTGSWFGWPADATWQRHWRPDPVVKASLEREVSPTDPSGAGEFLQARLATDEPFRYVGYGGTRNRDDPARAGDYIGRRFDPVVRSLLVNGRPIFLGLDEIQGYNPIELLRYEEFVTAINGERQNYHFAYLLRSGTGSPLLDLLDVQYAVVDATIPPDRADIVALRQGRTEVFRTPEVVVYQRDAPLPHAWIVHDARSVQRGEALPLLVAGAVDPYQTALIEAPSPTLAQPPADAVESARVTRYDPDELAIEVNAAADGVLVVSEIYADGWSATVDGQSTPVFPTDHALRGLAVPSGQHTVVLRYEPLAMRAGLAVSALTLIVMVAAGVWAWRSSPRPEARSARGGNPRRAPVAHETESSARSRLPSSKQRTPLNQ